MKFVVVSMLTTLALFIANVVHWRVVRSHHGAGVRYFDWQGRKHMHVVGNLGPFGWLSFMVLVQLDVLTFDAGMTGAFACFSLVFLLAIQDRHVRWSAARPPTRRSGHS